MNKILMYHSVGSSTIEEVGAGLYCVSVEKFREQMEYLALSFQLSALSQIIVTFDDGLVDNYTNAYPVLKQFGLKGYFFILVGKIGSAGYMNWEQIRKLKEAGMIIGSHGMTHRILEGLSDEDLDYELRESKEILEEELKAKVEHLSIPRGFTNKNVIEKAKKAGYKSVFTSNPNDNDGFKRGRIAVKGNWSLEKFIYVINNGLPLKDKAVLAVQSSAKKVLGARKYDKIRSALLK